MNKDSLITELMMMLKPEDVAVLIIDKQNGYLDQNAPLIKKLKTNTEDAQAVATAIDEFVKKVRQFPVKIIWTQMVEDVSVSPANIATKMRLGDTPSVINPKNASFEIWGETKPVEGDKVIVKENYDAFSGTDLHQYLQASGVKTVIITGVIAARCILATAFAASGKQYNVFVPPELIGAPQSMEDEIATARSVIDAILGYTISSGEILKIWSQS